MFNRPTFYLALIGIVAIGVLVGKLRRPEPASEAVAPPPRSPYADAIGARGIVESLEENVRIAPAIPGRIDKVFVKVGDRVKKGDPLFEVDSRSARADVILQERQLEVATARLKEADVIVQDRLAQLQRSQTLLAKNAGSEDQEERTRWLHQSAVSAQESARADLELAKAQLEKARVNVDLCTVRAPRDGTVLQVSVREGEYAGANPQDALLLIGEIASLQLRADVDEEVASRVKPGAPAVAFLKGNREEPIPLQFVRIDPYILPKRSLTGESTERVDTRVLQVIYRFENPAFPVYVGQQVDVFIESTR